jgi:hypothetical protein
MKAKSVLLAVMMMGASLVALANEPGNPRVRIVNQKESGIYRLIYAGGKSENVKLNILDDAGQVLFNETIKSKDGFIRSLNFKGVPPGEYTVEVENDGIKEVSKVNYGSSRQPAANHVRVAKTQEEGKYLLTVSSGGKESVGIKIYDGMSNLVHDEILKVDGSYGVVYNLRQVSGNPTFQVTSSRGMTTIVK